MGSREDTGGFVFGDERDPVIEKSNSELYILVHPDYAVDNRSYKDLGLDEVDYSVYQVERDDEVFNKAEDENTEIMLLTPEERNLDYLAQNSLEPDIIIETQVRGENNDEVTGLPTGEGTEELMSILAEEDYGNTVFAGEINGLCVGQAEQIVYFLSNYDELSEEAAEELDHELNTDVEQVAEDLNIDIDGIDAGDLNVGEVFPEEPVERTEKGLRYSEDPFLD